MDDITASIIVSCQTSGAAASIDKLGFSIGMLSKKVFQFGKEAVGEFQKTQDAAWKFGKTFPNIMGSAEKAVDEFMDSYNLSEQTARQMLTDTAQVLKGMGFAEKEALKVSESVSRWGVDLASFTGYAGGAKGAVEAITAAMLGENERLKGLGIVIREDSEEYRNLVQHIAKTKNVSDQAAAAYAKLELITRKAADAKGDYMAEGENFTQTLNIMSEMLKQVTSDFGEVIYKVLGLNDKLGGLGATLKNFTKEWKKDKDDWIFAIREVWINIEGVAKMTAAIFTPLWNTFYTLGQNAVKMGAWIGENWGGIFEILKIKMESFGSSVSSNFKFRMLEIAREGATINAFIAGLFDPKKGKSPLESAYLNAMKVRRERGSEMGLLLQKQIEQEELAKKAEQKIVISDLPNFAKFDVSIKSIGDKWDEILDDMKKKQDENWKKLTSRVRPQDKKKTDGDTETNTGTPKSKAAFPIDEVAKEFFKFHATTQGAILSNSVEGMRLQSRIFTNTSTDPAKQSADHLKKIEDQNKTIVNAVETLSRLLTGISGNGLKLAGVATKKY